MSTIIVMKHEKFSVITTITIILLAGVQRRQAERGEQRKWSTIPWRLCPKNPKWLINDYRRTADCTVTNQVMLEKSKCYAQTQTQLDFYIFDKKAWVKYAHANLLTLCHVFLTQFDSVIRFFSSVRDVLRDENPILQMQKQQISDKCNHLRRHL